MKKITAMFLLVFLLVGLNSYAFAWAPKDQGQPDVFRPGDIRGYFIWHDEVGMHLWTSTRGTRHVFSGVIRTNGAFVDAYGKRPEGEPLFQVARGQDTLTFRLETEGGAEGVNFRIDGGSWANFDLFIDGRRIDPDEIFIGDRSFHPRRSDFTLFR
ncbi:MAG: hypothetical protein P4N59_06390 [Negativicutes bacterium]|nr:hypothetical protein [Negativicutes bacterium]